MHDLFADALVTWMHARKSGVTLEDHVLAEVARNTGTDLEHETRALPSKRRRRSRRPWVPIVVVVALIAVAYAITRVVLTAG
jgi:t-SNARE complex subunit (syntaxin)